MDSQGGTEAAVAGPDAVRSRVYWDNVEPTVNGMLGGFSRISPSDASESRRFLSQWFQPLRTAPAAVRPASEDSRPRARLALDCGAGIGRISKLLLLSFAEESHLLEQSQLFLDKSLEYMGGGNHGRVKCICSSLQSFRPEAGVTYDIVWLQWVTGYLTDDELTSFLRRMASSLGSRGKIFVKDNVTAGDQPDTDMNDASVTRPRHSLLRLFSHAGLQVVQEVRQKKLPKGLYPVIMFALSPDPLPRDLESRTQAAS